MTKAFRTWDLLRGLPAAVLILAVFAQALIPNGWMPDLRATGKSAVVLCSSIGKDLTGNHSPTSDNRRMDQVCPYAAIVLANLPESLPQVIAPAIDGLIHRATATPVLISSHAGPPFGSRAPPPIA
jgi:hypothetical protein